MSAINTRFYGAEEDWNSFSTNCPELKTSGVTDPDQTLSTTQQTAAIGSVHAFSYNSDTNPEGLATVPLDPSICPWGIGVGSDVFDQKYPYPSIVSGTGIDNFQFKVRVSDYYKPKDNKGYRFFISRCRTLQTMTGATDGTWSSRYAELSLRTELNSIYIYQRPIVEFDYSKAYIVPYLLYVNKSYIDDKTTPHTSTSVNRVELGRIKASDGNPLNIDDNYVYGVQFNLEYEGLETAHTLSIYPFDDIEPSDMASGPYYPYGRKYTHYGTPFITAYDTGQINRCSIGGTMNVIIRDNNEFIDTEEAIYNKNYSETTNLRHYNFPTVSGDTGDYVLCNYIRRNGNAMVSLVPWTMNTLGRDGILDYVMEQAAYLGFRFKLKTADTDYYLPIMDSNGITTGDYLASNDPDIENQDNNSWTTDVFERSPYSPGGGDDDDPNTYTDTSSYVSISSVYAPTTERYLMTNECLRELLTQLQKISIPFAFPEEYDPDDLAEYTAEVMRAFGTTNPLELIDAIIAYPVDFGIPLDTTAPQSTRLISGTSGSLVVVGNSHCDISKGGLYPSGAQHIESEAPYLFFPNWEYYNKYKSFLDYSPYSSSVLTLPWCGSVNLDPEIYIGNRLNILYSVDIDTGLCKAVLYNDGKVVDSINGQVGARIAIETADYNNQVNAAIQANQIQQQQKFNQIKSIASIATAGLATVATGGAGATGLTGQAIGTAFNMAQSQMTIDQANYKVEAATVPYKQVVSGTDSMSLMSVNGIHQVIYRPKFLPSYDAIKYGNQVGFATLEFGPLSDYHGYTEVETVNFDGVFATEKEQEMIKAALKSGVYLP